MSFSGPLPPPALLNQYPPEVVKVIIDLAVKDQQHMHNMQMTGMQAEIDRDRRGQSYAFWVAIAVLVIAGCVAPFSTTVAGIIAGVDVIGLAAVFLGGRYLEAKMSKSPRGDEDSED